MSVENKLPQGWVECAISDVSIKGEQRKPDEHENFIYVDIGSINRDKKCIENPQSLIGGDAPSRARKVIEAGDVLVSLTRPNLNAVALVTDEYSGQIASTGFEVIKPQIIDSRIIFALTKTKYFVDEISGVVQGALYPAAKSSDVQSVRFPLPPLAEQQVIADKLDTLLAQVEATKTRLERIPDVLKRFRQSVLTAAVSGKLTEEWRENAERDLPVSDMLEGWLDSRKEAFYSDTSNKKKKYKQPAQPDLDTNGSIDIPSSWKIVSVSQFAECLDNKRIPVKKADRSAAEGLYPYFGANGEVDRVDEYIFDGDYVLVTEDETFYGREKPIAYRFTGKCWVNNHAHVLSAANKEANDYLCYCLMHYHVIPWLSGTTGRAKLTQAALNSLPIALPHQIEIEEIVRRVEQLFAYADTIERQVEAAQQRVNQLTQSILAKAFRGELTADWRAANPDLISGENSAEALLARIKAERQHRR